MSTQHAQEIILSFLTLSIQFDNWFRRRDNAICLDSLNNCCWSFGFISQRGRTKRMKINGIMRTRNESFQFAWENERYKRLTARVSAKKMIETTEEWKKWFNDEGVFFSCLPSNKKRKRWMTKRINRNGDNQKCDVNVLIIVETRTMLALASLCFMFSDDYKGRKMMPMMMQRKITRKNVR